MRPPLTADSRRVLSAVAIAFAIAVALALRPLAAPLMLAAWLASIFRPVMNWLTRHLRGRAWAGGLLTLLLLVTLLAPVVYIGFGLAEGATQLAHTVSSTGGVREKLQVLVTKTDEKDTAATKPQPHAPAGESKEVAQMAQEHGAAVGKVGLVAFELAVGLVVFLFILGFGTYTLLVKGLEAKAWLRDHSPLEPAHFDRLAAAFDETGRGLLASIGLTAVVQGILCTITYSLLGLPRALVLGFITALFSVMPVVGTPLVWGPLAIALAVAGEAQKAIILVVVGGGVIAVVENVVSPLFTKLAKLQLPVFLLVVSMFGGALAFGPDGILLGPLVLRMAREAWDIDRELRGPAAGQGTGPIVSPDAASRA